MAPKLDALLSILFNDISSYMDTSLLGMFSGICICTALPVIIWTYEFPKRAAPASAPHRKSLFNVGWDNLDCKSTLLNYVKVC